MKTHICYNCGGDEAIHQFETMKCPLYGAEATPGQKQVWVNTFFEDKGIKALHNAAPRLLAEAKKMIAEITVIANSQSTPKRISSKLYSAIDELNREIYLLTI